MCLDRRIGAIAVVALTLAGCGGGATPDAGPRTTYDYVTAVRPLAYENAHAACRGHSLTSLTYEYGTKGSTFTAAARSWARRNQPDTRLREVSYRGCRDGLRETAERPVLVTPPALTADEIDVYVVAYATCLGLTVAELVQEYGLDAQGLTVEQAVRAVVRKTYGWQYRDPAYDACLAAIRGEPPRYGS
jgi:hypothetical protein